ncbi:MAG: hypothetical protein V3U30_00830 [Thermoplasmata archaeon]
MAVDVELGSLEPARTTPSTHAPRRRTEKATVRSAAPLLVALLLYLLSGSAFAQSAPLLEMPAYTEGDTWEYRVEGRLDELPGIENLSASMRLEGAMTARVSSVGTGNATLTWAGRFSVQGEVTLPGDQGLGPVTLSGTLRTTFIEERMMPYVLATAFWNEAKFDLAITIGISVSASATLEMAAAIPPGPGAPTYPLEEGEHAFTTTATVESTVTVSLPILGTNVSSSIEEVPSSLRLEVTPIGPMEFPLGTFDTVRLVTEAVMGLAPSPFLVVLPGSSQVAYHAEEVGNPVALRFLRNGTEVGNASLQSYAYASRVSPPFWQHPVILGGLLAIPVALLLYRYWRERQRGL